MGLVVVKSLLSPSLIFVSKNGNTAYSRDITSARFVKNMEPSYKKTGTNAGTNVFRPRRYADRQANSQDDQGAQKRRMPDMDTGSRLTRDLDTNQLGYSSMRSIGTLSADEFASLRSFRQPLTPSCTGSGSKRKRKPLKRRRRVPYSNQSADRRAALPLTSKNSSNDSTARVGSGNGRNSALPSVSSATPSAAISTGTRSTARRLRSSSTV